MKRYKKLLLQVGILLFICGIFLFILEQRKRFITIDFSKRYAQNKTIELAGFEEGEGWQGNFSYDSERLMEGKSSITFSSWYGKENDIEKMRDISLPTGYTNGYLSIYILNSQNQSSIDSFTLTISGEKDQQKKYDLTRQIAVGWNRLPIAIPGWKKITKMSFGLLSKKGVIAEVNLDRMWIENTSVYATELFAHSGKALSIRTIGERTYLFSSSPNKEEYVLSNPSSLSRGSITFSLIPEHNKEAVLAVNGSSLKLQSESPNACSVSENQSTPVSHVLKKITNADNIYVFLKAEIVGGKIVYSLSNNGFDFETCGSAKQSGKSSIRLSLKGSYLIDSYSVEY